MYCSPQGIACKQPPVSFCAQIDPSTSRRRSSLAQTVLLFSVFRTITLAINREANTQQLFKTKKGEGVPWYTGVLLGAERFMAVVAQKRRRD